MYTGSLPTISNRADWKFEIELTDNDTSEVIDTTNCTMNILVRDGRGSVLLEGALSNPSDAADKITVLATGVIQVWFTEDNVDGLVAGSYDAGMTITGSTGEVVQLFVGTVSVIDGVVA